MIKKIILIFFIFLYTSIIYAEKKRIENSFNSNKTGYMEIYSLNSSNIKDIKMLTNSKDFNFWPRWSLKAKKILFCSMQFTSDGFNKSKIHIMDEDGKNIKKLTEGESDDFFQTGLRMGKK